MLGLATLAHFRSNWKSVATDDMICSIIKFAKVSNEQQKWREMSLITHWLVCILIRLIGINIFLDRNNDIITRGFVSISTSSLTFRA